MNVRREYSITQNKPNNLVTCHPRVQKLFFTGKDKNIADVNNRYFNKIYDAKMGKDKLSSSIKQWHLSMNETFKYNLLNIGA